MINYGFACADIKSILIVRLGAMGDMIHSLPGAASLRHSFPAARITWVVEPRWVPLIEGNGFVDRIVRFRRGEPGTWSETKRELRSERYDLAVDFQGLLKSALIAQAARPERIAGFAAGVVRERLAGFFYSARIPSNAVHVVDQALDLAAGAGATNLLRTFPLPPGIPEGDLPAGPFVLASPLAGWTSKQWPLEYYEQLAAALREKLNLPLVLNGAPGSVPEVKGTLRHESGISGTHSCHAAGGAGGRGRQRTAAPGCRAEQIRGSDLRADRSRSQWSLWRRFCGLPHGRRTYDAPARNDDRYLDASDHAGDRIRGTG